MYIFFRKSQNLVAAALCLPVIENSQQVALSFCKEGKPLRYFINISLNFTPGTRLIFFKKKKIRTHLKGSSIDYVSF